MSEPQKSEALIQQGQGRGGTTKWKRGVRALKVEGSEVSSLQKEKGIQIRKDRV